MLTPLQVHQRCTKYRDRHCCGCTTPTGHQDIEPSEVAEASPDIRVLPRWHHLCCIADATTVALRRLSLGRHQLGQPYGSTLEQPRSQHRNYLLLPAYTQDLRHARVPKDVYFKPRHKYWSRHHDYRRRCVRRIRPGNWRAEEKARQHRHELPQSWQKGCGRI